MDNEPEVVPVYVEPGHVENGKPKRTRSAKPEKSRRRSRATVVQVTLSGDVANWVKTEAAANFRDLTGQIAYCVAQMMMAHDSGKP